VLDLHPFSFSVVENQDLLLYWQFRNVLFHHRFPLPWRCLCITRQGTAPLPYIVVPANQGGTTM
jgi:hypothetical protein